MGSYLSRGKATLPPPTGTRQSPPPRSARHQRDWDQSRVTDVQLKCRFCNQPLPTGPPGRNSTGVRRVMVPEAQRRFPNKPPLCSFTEPDFSSNEKTVMRQWLWNARNHYSGSRPPTPAARS